MWSTWSRTDIAREIDTLAAAGGRWMRFDIGWCNFEPTKGTQSTTYYSKLDYLLSQAQEHGIELQPAIMATPDWANGGRGMWTPPTNNADFANFVRYITGRYAGRITYWEIWNEPDLTYFWRPSPDAAAYTRLLQAAYVAAKQGNPNSVIISAGLVGNNKTYLQKMYDAGARGYFDRLGLHPYSGPRGPYAQYYDDTYRYNFGAMVEMKNLMEANGDAGKHIWVSEFGWQTGTAGEWPISEALQAQYIGDAYKRLMEEFPYVDAMMVYGLRNVGTNAADEQENFGMLRNDYTPKPSYAAYTNAAAALWSQVTLAASSSTISYGQSATLSVRVTPTGTTPVALQRLRRDTGQWEDVTATATAADGTAALSVSPTSTITYRAVATEKNLTSVNVTVKVRAKVTVKPSRSVVRRQGRVRLAGKIVPMTRATVVLQRKIGRRWVSVRRIAANAAGKYSTSIRARRRGRFTFRIRFYGNASHLGTVSRPTPLRVY